MAKNVEHMSRELSTIEERRSLSRKVKGIQAGLARGCLAESRGRQLEVTGAERGEGEVYGWRAVEKPCERYCRGW